jgi:dihydrofolate synthase/folylpolyglutamate synthase
MTYSAAIRYLESFINYENISSFSYKSVFDLERVRTLFYHIGNPQEKLKFIHIAGTKGKGSTCAFIYYVLKQAGKRTGLYTSPHLIDFSERIRIGDKNLDQCISKKQVCDIVSDIKPIIDKIKKEQEITFFEIYTALAFVFFLKKNVEWVVLEAGLGGRLDATNIVRPACSIITPIGYDHTEKLGSTLRAIAIEEGGILKKQTPAVFSLQRTTALNTLKKAADYLKADVWQAGEDFYWKITNTNVLEPKFDLFLSDRKYKGLKIHLAGEHQVMNASCAVAGILKSEIDITEQDIRQGLSQTKWPGRFQIANKNPLVILDGAQTDGSAKALACTFKKAYPIKKCILLFGISSDKNVKTVSKELFEITHTAILTQAKTQRAMSIEQMQPVFKKIGYNKIFCIQDNMHALEQAEKISRAENCPIVVAGSLFLVGDIWKKLLKKQMF